MSTFVLGDSKSICDVCGFDYKRSELRLRWDKALVCDKDWESRHPQDLIKVRKETNRVKDPRFRPDIHYVVAGENTADKL